VCDIAALAAKGCGAVGWLRSRLVGCCARWGGGRMAGRGGIVTEWVFHFLFDAFFSRKTKKFATRFA